MTAQKIATCCYCGTRAVLKLKGHLRHELTCSGCGAPLHEMKMLRTDARTDPGHTRETMGRYNPKYRDRDGKSKKYKSYKKKRKKPLIGRVFEEVFDVIEDILD